MRSIWTGSLSFGLINIPVRLYSGSEDRGGINLHMLHKTDMSTIRYAKICREEDKEVPYDEIVKGYEYGPDEYVVIRDDEFERSDRRRTKTIDIDEFTDETEIDVRYFDRPYYLEPDKNAEKPYALLREALHSASKVAVAHFVLRNREHLAAIKPVGRALILNQLRFPSELREPRQLDLPDESIATDSEIDLALKLIDQLTKSFIPEDFHDRYTEELQALIDAKVAGQTPKEQRKEPPSKPPKDLMAALKASLEQEQARTGNG